MEERYNILKNWEKNKTNFGSRHLYLFGQGALGPSVLFMLFKLFTIKPEQITIIDMIEVSKLKKDVDEIVRLTCVNYSNINVISARITKKNYKELLSGLKPNDLIVDCAINICCLDMIRLCQERNACYINSALYEWDDNNMSNPYEYSIYAHFKEIKEYVKSITPKFTAVLGTGCNPGMVSTWTQICIRKINEYYKNVKPKNAEELGVRTIHISEHDTECSNKPKEKDEYANTWSSTPFPFYEESLAPVEITLGTHEDNIANSLFYNEKDRFVIIDQLAMKTFAQSYTPIHGNYMGMLTRHEENITIGNKLSSYNGDTKTYAPSVYFVYQPCNHTMMSLYELTEKNYIYQTKNRILSDDIIRGGDELGVTFFLENGDIFWLGSLLQIEETRKMFDNKFDHRTNAAVLQVVGGNIAGIIYALKYHEQKKYGMYVSDDLPAEEIFELCKPFYGDFIFKKVEDWDYSRTNRDNKFSVFAQDNKDIIKPKWKLQDFLIDSSILNNKIYYNKYIKYKNKYIERISTSFK